ncbi:iron-containing redox enzyme family protein [Streptomyces sp. NBC_01387]|uniref:TenA family transcriptional regulator n=1 Tax=unclassified Streptomyces TaxID=2593676 RepID=UPI00224F5BA6|nr:MULTISPECIES: iron-containing redox enzyme family protein [unclassified Streptomyces]MCX4548653.1 iron-containing redox enzyme family protein [Streptomyces sp. NBC_01500]WSC20258.1 iron-containing redox enzyme family protein [Streptomyces sp. NBC_01766]WSV54280.1 iron-containing redox enzyme family protein [Streptomyces sp. NBC_01014]
MTSHLRTTKAPLVTARAKHIVAETGVLNNPYFRTLVDGSMSLESFRTSQEQLGFAVTYFARPMAVLVSRIEHPADRVGILGNVVEEHGGFRSQEFHHETFRGFLASIGSDTVRLNSLKMIPAVHAYNSVLSAVCTWEDPQVGIGCMGAIEYAFASVSAITGSTAVNRGWVAQADLMHYGLHSEIDEQHAEDFFLLLEPHYRDPAARLRIDQGLGLGAYALNRLYSDLSELGRSQQN